jgi:hypothetical protein
VSLLVLKLTTEPKSSFRAVRTEEDFVGEERSCRVNLSRHWAELKSHVYCQRSIKTETTTETIGRETIENLATKVLMSRVIVH